MPAGPGGASVPSDFQSPGRFPGPSPQGIVIFNYGFASFFYFLFFSLLLPLYK